MLVMQQRLKLMKIVTQMKEQARLSQDSTQQNQNVKYEQLNPSNCDRYEVKITEKSS